MIEKIMKAVKNSNKRRGRNITIGAVVGFLLSCTTVMGADNYLWIREKDNTIQFNTINTDDENGTKGNWNTTNPYKEVTWNPKTKTYTNNMTLSSSEANGINTNGDNISYGLRLSGNLTDVNFINNGSIIGTMSGNISSYGYGFGIYNKATIEDITNAGIISGAGYGFGIYNTGKMGNIENKGIISGYGDSDYGDSDYGDSDYGKGSGIYNDSNEKKMGNITNKGIISVYSSGITSGYSYGIYNKSGTIGDITNTGIMSVSGNGTSSNSSVGNGYGINNKGTIGDITNTGIINGFGYSISNTGWDYGFGIYNKATIEDITNAGIISGTGYSNGLGYGIYNDSNGKKMGNIENKGIISGSGSDKSYGIRNFVTMKNITNTGVISGTDNGTGTGSGIYNQSGTIGAITNTGVIYGKTNAIKNNKDIQDNIGTITATNNYGILVNGDSNNDVVDGLKIVDETPKENEILNKGLIFTAVGGTYKATAEEYKQFGKTYVDENIVIDYQEDGTGKPDLSNPITKKYTIINAKAVDDGLSVIDTEKKIIGTESLKLENGTLSYTDSDDKEQTENISPEKRYILNGITNTLKVSGKNNELNDSIINAYGTAVVFGDTGDKKLTLSGTIVNGGIDESDSNPGTKVAAILGSNGEDTLILQSIVSNQGTQNTVINGNINMGAGADTLTIGDGTIINGTLDGGTGDFKDTLNFGISSVTKSIPAKSQEIKIMHNITNFENINIGENTNVTLFEKTIGAKGEETALEVSGVKEIDIKAGGVLNLRIGSQKSTDGRYEGHALFGNKELKINGDISQLPDGKTEIEEIEGEKYNVGVFNLVTNGLGINSIIAMDGITLNENLFVKTNSILDKATIIKNPSGSEKEGDIKIEGEKDIFEMYVDKSKRYIKLNEIYKGIYSSEAENFNALKDILTLSGAGGDYTSVTYKDQLARLLSYLNNIYTETPYSFSSELSRKSMGMFRDIITENQFKPNLNQWLIMGGLTHRDGGTKDTYYGKNYHGFDTGTADVDVDMKLTGAYALGKYGYSENVSLGVTAGGNRSEAKLPMSKVKGNSGYVGAFAENYRGNLTLKAGAGIQYSEYDADRATLGGHSYSDKYSDMTYDIYLNGKYSHNIGENLFLEPYGTLSYTYVDQEGADEGSKVLAIETDSKSFDYTAAKVGVDLKKIISHEKGKSTLSAGVSYTRLLTGADEEDITGRFKGENATDFDILVPHKNEHSIGLNAKYALELESGILFDVKGSYNVERDSHNGTGKNRNKGEWIVGAGLGYKF